MALVAFIGQRARGKRGKLKQGGQQSPGAGDLRDDV